MMNRSGIPVELTMRAIMHKLPVTTLAALLFSVTPAVGHFNMLLPEKASAKKGEAVTLVYQWGHPFEHQLFDAPQPERVYVVEPDGKRTDLQSTLEAFKIPAGEGKQALAYRLRFTPASRGDYVFVVRTRPIWMGEEGEFFEDTVKVVLHVQAQKGWDSSTGEPLEIVPMTRPYGLEPGMVFQSQLQWRAPGRETPVAPVITRPVEIEHYNPTPPQHLPSDEHVTRTARPDANGVVTSTLTEAGWWCVTASRPHGTREHDGKLRPVLERSTIWVFVDDKPSK
jgi:cobalt/nickel transport protein